MTITQTATCPIASTDLPQCPMRTANELVQCPVSKGSESINPKNNMPHLPQSRAPGQILDLPTDRITSSIPRPVGATYDEPAQVMVLDDNEGASNWEYPSPQQFYNALIRKGWNTPEEHVEAMVLIHNRLNEDAWRELLKWEARFGGGPSEAAKVELARFSGIHGHMSHKSWIYQLARRWLPKYFKFAPPFDRHDWIIRRPRTGKHVRYVIDYYSSRKTPFHEPDLHLDVRPASDSAEAIYMKLRYPLEQFLSQALAKDLTLFSSTSSLGSRTFMLCASVALLLVFLYGLSFN